MKSWIVALLIFAYPLSVSAGNKPNVLVQDAGDHISMRLGNDKKTNEIIFDHVPTLAELNVSFPEAKSYAIVPK